MKALRPSRVALRIAITATVAVMLLIVGPPVLAQSKRIPARLIYLIDERPTGQLYTFSSGDTGCEFDYPRKLAAIVAQSNWTTTFTNSCGTFTHTQQLFKAGPAYWTYGTDQTKPNGYGPMCNIPMRSIDSLVGPPNCGYATGSPRSDVTNIWQYPWVGVAYTCPNGDYIFDQATKTCLLPYAEPHPPERTPRCGNPVMAGSGCKLETVALLSIRTGSSPLNLELRYAALFGRGGGRLVGNESWFLEPLDRRLLLPTPPLVAGTKITALRPDGGFEEFTVDGSGAWSGLNNLVRLEAAGSGWRLTDFADQTMETFDAVGRLQEFARFDGSHLRVIYEDSTSVWPSYVESSVGVQVHFQRNASGISRLTGPDGLQTSLDYTPASVPGLTYSGPFLESVTFNDNSRRSFTYVPAWLAANVAINDLSLNSTLRLYSAAPPFVGLQGADLPYLVQGRAPMTLSGIADEHGQSFAHFEYDHQGRTTLSEHIGGVQRFRFAYSTLRTDVTEPLGATTAFNFQNINGRNLLASHYRTGPNGLYRGYFYYYDGLGNLNRLMSNTGSVTHCVTTDPVLGKETARIEGLPYAFSCAPDLRSFTPRAGTVERKVLTDWNAEWRLPTRRSEPKKITTWTYHGQGGNCAPSTPLSNGKLAPLLCSISEQATSDENGGLGFAAATAGAPRTWNFTYTTYGRVATISDPNGKLTQYTYYADNHVEVGKRGSVASITNAVNHTTQITDYTPNGQPTRVVDANGQVISFTYDPRSRLTSQTLGNELTRYDYDVAGQLTRVTLPDGAYVSYSYDAAHRLTAITDQSGNKLTYTLDAQGNRVAEKSSDPQGTLVRNVERVLDAFSQVRQLTGVQ